MDTRLLDLLVCPVCKGPLEHRRPPTSDSHELSATPIASPSRCATAFR